MAMENLVEEIQRLRFQITKLSESLDSKEYPIQCLVISLNWSEKDLNDADGIFEEYDRILKDKTTSNPLVGFETKLRDRLRIDYQTVQRVILAFYDGGKWVDVCKGYAKDADVSELQCINRPKPTKRASKPK
jgi:hypothetical protein